MSDELAASPGRFRTLAGAPAKLLRTLLISSTVLGSLWALEVHNYFEITFFKQQYLALFLALSLCAVFLAVKAYPKQSGDHVPWYDWFLALGGMAIGLYVTILYPTIAYRLGVLSPDRWIFGGLALILVIEATRRVAGGTLAWLALGVILYTKFAEFLPGIFYSKSPSWARIASYLYLDSNAMLGLPIDVAAGVVVAFILFGQALYAVGGDKFLTDLALIATGRYRGGPAKVSVVSSALFGTVSGSAVANVVVDGAITIPLMKRTGFPAHMAAAIEAVASNGGQIMPPVMGAAAFLMAEFLAIPYGQVALAAAIPACLYYLALFTQIDLEAAKRGLAGLPADQIPKFRKIIKSGWVFLIPLSILVYTLMIENWEAGKAGMVAVIVVFVVGALQKETRPSFKKIVAALEETGKIILDIAVITALAGIVIGALHLSGFTFKISLLLVTLSGNNVFLLLIITALGMFILRIAAADDGRVHHASGARRAGPRAARHTAARRSFISILLRHGLSDHPARLPAGLYRRVDGSGQFLANRLDRHAPRHRRLHRPVYFRAPSAADSDGHIERDPYRSCHRCRWRDSSRRRLRGLFIPPLELDYTRTSLASRDPAAPALDEQRSSSRRLCRLRAGRRRRRVGMESA